jgi:single-strand selective monofunctional uracil DNA glycosylase
MDELTLKPLALRLRTALDGMTFAEPVSHVYNPLHYAWAVHDEYLERYASGRKRVLFLGMNPGPWGMVQTGVPFGEVPAVRDWLGIMGPVVPPVSQHPARPVTGFNCERSEISGQRLWRLFRNRFGVAASFFAQHTVLNYCPLAFLESTGRNRTPEKLPRREREALFAACDEHLRDVVRVLRPEWLIGVGKFATERARLVCGAEKVQVECIPHPSPANPAANRDWAERTTERLRDLGVWD